MKIKFVLQKHCIHTAARRYYEKTISQYFKKTTSLSVNRDCLEKDIDILQYFLENADISQIRSKYPDLNGQKVLTIILDIPDLKNPKTWQFKYLDQHIDIIWKQSKH